MAKKRAYRAPVVQPLDPSYNLIPLTQGQVALVDAGDYAWLSQWNWAATWKATSKSFYASRCKDGKHAYMHREIMQSDSRQVDHVNHNGLDNRRFNLRPATRSQNSANSRRRSDNTSNRKGVCWDKARRRWAAEATVNGVHVHLGRHLSKEAAYAAYSEFAKRQWGDFARV